jgi:hypothetical protein
VLADLDETIRQLVVRHVPLDLGEVDVSFETPDRDWSGRLSRPTLNCFLYDIGENLELRQSEWEVTRPSPNHTRTRRRGVLRVNVTYNVAVWAKVAEDEHRLLWRVYAALARHPIIPPDVMVGEIREQIIPINARVGQPDAARASVTDLWQAVDNRIRPSLRYTVVVPLDPEVSITSPMVFTRDLRTAVTDATQVETLIDIGGRVRDRAHPEQPLVGATVRLAQPHRTAVTDNDGRFILRRVPRGRIVLTVSGAGRRKPSEITTEVPAASYDLEA